MIVKEIATGRENVIGTGTATMSESVTAALVQVPTMVKKVDIDTENTLQIKVMIVITITEIKVAGKKKTGTKNAGTVTKRRGDTNLPEAVEDAMTVRK